MNEDEDQPADDALAGFDWTPSPEEHIRDHLARFLSMPDCWCTHWDGGNCPYIEWNQGASTAIRLAELVATFVGHETWSLRTAVLTRLRSSPDRLITDPGPLFVPTRQSLFLLAPDRYLDFVIGNPAQNIDQEFAQSLWFWQNHRAICERAKQDLDALQALICGSYRGE